MRELPLKERDASAQPQGNELKAWRSAVDVALDTIDEKTKSQAYQVGRSSVSLIPQVLTGYCFLGLARLL
jgi:hypothetical protein